VGPRGLTSDSQQRAGKEGNDSCEWSPNTTSLSERERESFKLYIVCMYMNGTHEFLFVCEQNFILPTK